MREMNIENISIAEAAKILNLSKEEVRDLFRSVQLKYYSSPNGRNLS